MVSYTEKLINAMLDYGIDNDWNDNEIIERLIECGITEHDFIKCGFPNFVHNYFSNV